MVNVKKLRVPLRGELFIYIKIFEEGPLSFMEIKRSPTLHLVSSTQLPAIPLHSTADCSYFGVS